MLKPLLAAALAALALAATPAAAAVTADTFSGRALFVHVPAALPPAGQRALVIVLHGGLGNAARIAGAGATPSGGGEHGLNLDALADKDGFVVAYLSGTPVTLKMGPEYLGWNAGGGCCGQSAIQNVDDVGYIRGAVAYLAGKYGVDPALVYAIGHSNGAIMSQRLICETRVLAAAVAVSGPLNLPVKTCPQAKGLRVLSIHGTADDNVPLAGGIGVGLSKTPFAAEAVSQKIMQDSGVTYELDLVQGAPHKLDDIDAAMRKAEGISIGEKAVRFFGLAK